MRHSVYMSYPISSVVLYFFFPKLGLYLILCSLFVCFIICPSVSCCFFLIHFISAAVILLASLALMVQLSLLYNKTGRASVLYNFILVKFLRTRVV